MCGRFALGINHDEYEARIERDYGRRFARWEGRDEFRPSYNVSPTSRAPVIRAAPAHVDESAPAAEFVQTMRWGVIPHWQKEMPAPGQTMHTINARCEAVEEGSSGLWNSLRGSKRCVIACEGFYEWLAKGKEKLPYFTKRKDGRMFLFAGLWDVVNFPGEPPLHTFTILTTNAAPSLTFLHTRMPVVLPTWEVADAWLDCRKGWTKEVRGLMKSWEGEVESYAVTKEVSKPGPSSPTFIQPISQRKDGIASFFAKQAVSKPAKFDTVSPSKPTTSTAATGPSSFKSAIAASEPETSSPPASSSQKRRAEVIDLDEEEDGDGADDRAGDAKGTKAKAPPAKKAKPTPTKAPEKGGGKGGGSKKDKGKITGFFKKAEA